MKTKYTPVYEDDAADLGSGIPAQTEEEAANEAAMNSPAERARRNVSDAENQIRADAIAKLANKVAPAMKMDNAPEIGTEGKRTSMEIGPAAKRTPMVTKEQLAASGLSLRDYLNKQQGLTRRDESSAPASKSTRMPTSSGQEVPMYSNEGRNKPRLRGQGTVMDQGRGVDLYGGSINDIKNMFKGTKRGGGDYAKGGAVKKMASGGSVSSASKRADGIAQRGKTKCKMC